MQEYIKKVLGFGCRHSSSSALHNTKLIISHEKMNDLIEIVKSLEDSGLLLKEFSKTIQNEPKDQKGGFLSILLGTLDVGLLGNILGRKGINKAGKGIVRAGYGNKKFRKTTIKNKKNF